MTITAYTAVIHYHQVKMFIDKVDPETQLGLLYWHRHTGDVPFCSPNCIAVVEFSTITCTGWSLIAVLLPSRKTLLSLVEMVIFVMCLDWHSPIHWSGCTIIPMSPKNVAYSFKSLSSRVAECYATCAALSVCPLHHILHKHNIVCLSCSL